MLLEMHKLDNGKWRVSTKIEHRSWWKDFHTKENATYAVNNFTLTEVASMFTLVEEAPTTGLSDYYIEADLTVKVKVEVRSKSEKAARSHVENDMTLRDLLACSDEDSLKVTVTSAIKEEL